jgi:pseudouridine synthase
MELREGRNRQIRRMMAQVGHPVKRLRRIQIGPLKLKGLRVGEWREPTAGELATLKRVAYGKKALGIRH